MFVFIIQGEILTNQSVREMSNEPYLFFWKVLMMERCYLSEITQVSQHGAFGMVRLLLDVGELIPFEVQFQDLGFMRNAGAPYRAWRRESLQITLAVSTVEYLV